MCDNKPDSIFGSLVFNEDVMRRRLSNTCYRAWKQCVEEGTPLRLETAHVMDCIECGCCAYICPGRLHLTQTFRTGKQKILNARAKAKAEAEAKAAEEKKKEA